ncbi:hypothetical protein FB565_003356 [Actinoplanes lutulentus]|uniref:Class 3 adenylate cyclase n=1 Tax=Actinoplanes lutulentus TaxID=1287878 RepID=A0A327Z063_9ACTN|nr:hypothetical protein [Actinoplanes lutulentus]MBB2943627.1 hypothetical protein [Actinoplanes lutulentus]RAK27492.1 hypothetical protein B0I29_123126 [Actinoplanes lutulentus]
MDEQRHSSIVVLDVEKSGQMSVPEKGQVREEIYAMLRGACLASNISADAVTQEDRGDGVYLLVSADVPKRRIVGPFLDLLDETLADRRVGAVRLRLRVVVSSGEVAIDRYGSMGPAVDAAFAVLDASVLKQTLAVSPSARMVVAIDDDLYRSVVRGHTSPDPTAFRLRDLKTKDGVQRVWVTATGTEIQPAIPGNETLPASSSRARAHGPDMTVHNGGQQWEVNGAHARVAGNVHGDANFGADPAGR